MILTSIITLWVLWSVWRLYLSRSEFFVFDWDGVHHADFGFAVLAQGLLIPGWFGIFEIAFGIILIIDDSIGHWRAAHGKPETFVLEPVLNWLLKIFGSSFGKLWGWINKK